MPSAMLGLSSMIRMSVTRVTLGPGNRRRVFGAGPRCRQADEEPCALADRSRHAGHTVIGVRELGELPDHRELDPGTRSAPAMVEADKRLPDLRGSVGGNARSLVVDPH